MDTVKSVTDLCDGKAFSEGGTYQTSHCSVMAACWRVLEEVDRNHPLAVCGRILTSPEEVDRNHPMTPNDTPNHCGAEEARRAHNPKDG